MHLSETNSCFCFFTSAKNCNCKLHAQNFSAFFPLIKKNKLKIKCKRSRQLLAAFDSQEGHFHSAIIMT